MCENSDCYVCQYLNPAMAVDQCSIDTPEGQHPVWPVCQIVVSRVDDTVDLPLRQPFRCRVVSRSFLDLDKDILISVAADQVDFPLCASPASFKNRKPAQLAFDGGTFLGGKAVLIVAQSGHLAMRRSEIEWHGLVMQDTCD